MRVAALQTGMLTAQTGNPTHLLFPSNTCLNVFKNNCLYQKHIRSISIRQLRAAPNPESSILQHKATQVHLAFHSFLPLLLSQPSLRLPWEGSSTYTFMYTKSKSAKPAVAWDDAKPAVARDGLQVVCVLFCFLLSLFLLPGLSFCLGQPAFTSSQLWSHLPLGKFCF